MSERSRENATHDPFAVTPDPKVYVPRAATEMARKELLRSACNPAKTSALIGPPGLGKTLLLHLLAEEVPEELQTVYLPYAALPPEELCAWSLELLGLPATADPLRALQACGRNLRERGSALLMLIDDAGSMPIATARWAGDLLQGSDGGVRLAIAASDNATGNRTIAAVGTNFDIVHLDDPMTESETSKYIDGRLALARVPDSVRARFDPQTVRLLHRISAGIPRRLHAAATAILQEAPIVSAGGRAGAPAASATAPAAAPAEPPRPATTLGAPAEERRVSRRRAEPEGIAVRVGPGSGPAQKGRRAEDRVEPQLEPSESSAEASAEPTQSPAQQPARPPGPIVAEQPSEAVPMAADAADEPEPNGNEEVDEDPAPERDFSIPPTPPRRARSASRRSIALGTLVVAFAAVGIPVIRSILAEPVQIVGTDRKGDPRESIPGGFRESIREDRRESLQPNLSEPPDIAGAPDGEPPMAQPSGSFAVQINATPWANVEVDGVDLGATPLANIPLFGGPHAFRVEMPDGRVIDRTIEIDAENRFISFE